MTTERKTSQIRRTILKAGASASLTGLSSGGVWAAGSDKPEKEEVKIGFIPLTDCASVVMASVLGFDKKYGIKIVLSKEVSWAGVRDKLVNGELDAAHVLYGLIYGVQMGIGGAEERHGGADEPEPQRPGHHAVEESGRQGRRGRRVAGQADADRQARVLVRPDLPDRHPRDVAVLLARHLRHQPDEGRQGDHRAAAADGGQYARR